MKIISHLTNDPYHRLLKVSWPRFISILALIYLVINFLFALLYFAMGTHGLAGIRSQNALDVFIECFFFSVQTFSTIGYGSISPIGLGHNIVVSIQALFGMISIGLMSGMFFSRFSRPTAKVVYSKNALITNYMGKRSLIFRLANSRMNQIMDASISVSILLDTYTPEGGHIYKLTDLPLVRSKTPIFAMSWMIIHEITSDSPFYNMDFADAGKRNLQIVAMAHGHDDIFNQTVHTRHSYSAKDLVFDRQFVDIIERKSNRLFVKIDKISELL